MGLNVRYSPLEWSKTANEFNFGGADITNAGNFNVNPTGGVDYYLDNNHRTEEARKSGDVSSWDKPYKTLSLAIAASNLSIAKSSNRWWAKRNRIFIAGDRITENLTVFPNKCDIIGVGSCDSFKTAGVRGNHTPTTGSGTRWFNVHFDPATAADMFTIASGTSAQPEFHNCEFKAAGAATAVSAIDITNVPYFKIIGCDFIGAFSGPIIDIGAGAVNGCRIVGNYMSGGANDGISETGVATVTGSERGLILNNFISVNNLVIDCAATSVFDIINNTCISAQALGANSYVIDLTYAAGNLITGNDISVFVPSCTTVA